AQSVRIPYKHPDTGELYTFNLIDTPGHVDFTYEVSRSLAACEGALLVVDAVQSVQAQTLANVYMALDANLEIVPVINKIDLPSARADKVREDIEDLIGLDASNAVLVSAKTGLGVPDLMKAIVARVPPPKGDAKAPLRALIFDSWFDPYQGAIVLTRVMEGEVRKGARVTLMREGRKHEVLKVGVFTPRALEVASLAAGDVGFIVAGIREVADAKVGDTITETDRPCAAPLPGFKEVKPMVFAGLYPTDSTDYPNLRDALEKLKLNDASFSYEPETSQALGFGFRLGFLGLLHMEIIQERLEREYDLSLITTAPTVSYRVTLTGGDVIVIDNPAKYPSPQKIETIEEPIIAATIYT
ncbi:MAG: translation elongation factor 4, partial [Candidatus Methylomirabilis sp.]|nr:translation elongation factor 4 [Deltaproteobacteria bacterium]